MDFLTWEVSQQMDESGVVYDPREKKGKKNRKNCHF